jgi:Flp pilus assembly protein TadG
MKRNNKGSAAIEIAAGALVTIIIVAFALNICLILIHYDVNDQTCRDAARAAAQGSSQSEAQALAQTVIRAHNTANNFLSPIAVSGFVYTDFGGQPPAGTSPFVTVATTSLVNTPVPMDLFGATLFSRVLTVRKSYTFPIVRLNAPATNS